MKIRFSIFNLIVLLFSICISLGWYVDRRTLSQKLDENANMIASLVQRSNEQYMHFIEYRDSKLRLEKIHSEIERQRRDDEQLSPHIVAFRIEAHRQVTKLTETFFDAERGLIGDSSPQNSYRHGMKRTSIISSIANLRRLLEDIDSKIKTEPPDIQKFYASKVIEIHNDLADYQKKLSEYLE